MSVENRKTVYDKLIAEGRESEISKELLKEFGEVKIKKEEESKPIPLKKKGKK